MNTNHWSVDYYRTITPREIRNKLEKALDLDEGSLDSERDRIKQLSQSVFAEVMVCLLVSL